MALQIGQARPRRGRQRDADVPFLRLSDRDYSLLALDLTNTYSSEPLVK